VTDVTAKAPSALHPATMLKLFLLTGMLWLAAATGATTLALVSIHPPQSIAAPLITSHLLKLQPDLALP
jgi:hypothetical protein